MFPKITDDMVELHKPLDGSDPGFTIAGWKMRWLGAAVSETRAGRPWMVIRRERLPKKVLEHIEMYRPMTFEKDDAYRHGDTILSAAPKHVADQYARENRQRAAEAMERIQQAPRTKQGSSAISVEEASVTDHTRQMADMFENKKPH
jgi:hypothetical protein